jgi:uncharacterized protein (TIGR00255 family)
MTGFGAATQEGPPGIVRWEIRSFNHRTLKISLRVPGVLASHESELEARTRTVLSRGAVNGTLRLERPTAPTGPLVDVELARAYAGRLADLARDLGVPGEPDLALLASLPGVIVGTTPRDEDTEAVAALAAAALDAALKELVNSRGVEGDALARDLEQRVARVEKALGRVEKRAPRALDAARRRLQRRVKEVLADQPADVAREAVAREAVLFAERSDIAEEVTRLRSHIVAFRAAAAAEGEIGRRLDFLLQEMLREVNTIGSKSQDAAIAAAVVDMKVEVDRMKEQAANVE